MFASNKNSTPPPRYLMVPYWTPHALLPLGGYLWILQIILVLGPTLGVGLHSAIVTLGTIPPEDSGAVFWKKNPSLDMPGGKSLPRIPYSVQEILIIKYNLKLKDISRNISSYIWIYLNLRIILITKDNAQLLCEKHRFNDRCTRNFQRAEILKRWVESSIIFCKY